MCLEFSSQTLEFLDVPSDQRDLKAFAGESFGDALPNAWARANDGNCIYRLTSLKKPEPSRRLVTRGFRLGRYLLRSLKQWLEIVQPLLKPY